MRSLPFVEPESVRASLASQQVLFSIKNGQSFDLQALRQELGKAGYDKVEVVSEPKASS